MKIFILFSLMSTYIMAEEHNPRKSYGPRQLQVYRPVYKVPNDVGSLFKPKNCLCEGTKHDGPLKGLCVIKCTCPGNCG
jgi:hypothetical protein